MYLVCIGLFYYFCTQKRVTWKQFKAERSIRHSCQVITSKSGNSSKVLCIRHKRKFSRITEKSWERLLSAPWKRGMQKEVPWKKGSLSVSFQTWVARISQKKDKVNLWSPCLKEIVKCILTTSFMYKPYLREPVSGTGTWKKGCLSNPLRHLPHRPLRWSARVSWPWLGGWNPSSSNRARRGWE